jgi:8-oxo-dGTP diphosphatase
MISTEAAGPDAGYRPCSSGRHWGPDGAAGALVYAGCAGRLWVLLSLRSQHVQAPLTWSTIGGAIDPGETAPQAAALRELGEETRGCPQGTVTGTLEAPCAAGCGWAYTTLVVRLQARTLPRVRVASDAWNAWETACCAWIPVHRVAALRLHPGLAAAWPALRDMIGG